MNVTRIITGAALTAILCCPPTAAEAADFTFRFAGLNIYKLSEKIEKVGVKCWLYSSVENGIGRSEIFFTPVTTPQGRQIVQGPFELTIDVADPVRRDSATNWVCQAFPTPVTMSNFKPAPCEPLERYKCYDTTQPHFIKTSGAFR